MIGNNNELIIRNTGSTYGYSTLPINATVTGAIGEETGEPNGFRWTNNDSIISFNESTREFTIIPTGSTFEIFSAGVKYNLTGNTITIPDVTQKCYIYYDNNASLTFGTSFDQTYIFNKVFVAVTYWDSLNKKLMYLGDERHGLMDPYTHYLWHFTFHTAYISGLGLTDFTIGNGSQNSHASYSILNGQVNDEDIEHMISAHLSGFTAKIFYISGSTINWFVEYNTLPVLTGGTGLIVYNNYSGNTWSLSEPNDNDYVLYHIMATNDELDHIHVLMGQSSYSTLKLATDGAKTEIGNLKVE